MCTSGVCAHVCVQVGVCVCLCVQVCMLCEETKVGVGGDGGETNSCIGRDVWPSLKQSHKSEH